MTLDILYFAWVRERIGTAKERKERYRTAGSLVRDVPP